ncbi:MAG: efflux RND transporter permease subunit [Puniceicoccales bacterium]|jgi:HAE1 family hydrophobic/amphiphilic exporter-1|nr:efflux RND transporter permease subunit [Puniceicoccales bacterium]
MKSISEPFIRRPVMTILLALTVVVFGLVAYIGLPVSDLPSVDYPVIRVSASFPGMDPESMASNVATPLEKEFLKIQGLELATSQSMTGQTFITLQFALERDVEAAAMDVQAAIQRSMGSLPSDMPSAPTYEKSDPNSHPIYYMALSSTTLTKGQLYDYASNYVAQRFNVISGVSKTEVYGVKRAVRIEVDPDRLSARGLTLDDVSQRVCGATTTVSGGVLRGEDRSWVVCPEGQLLQAEDYASIIIGQVDGAPVYLRDVASCGEGLEVPYFHNSFWLRGMEGHHNEVMLAVSRAAGANTVTVAKQLRTLIPEIRRQIPDSVFLTPVYDYSVNIMSSIRDVEETVFIAFGLVAVVIFLFLGRLRDTIIPLVALPLSLLILFIAMHFLGFTLDNLSLMAMTLSVGFLVDDAIVFLENMVRRMQRKGEDPEQASIGGAREISTTIVSMTLSLACIFIPLLFLGGQIGRVFHEFALVIVIATIASGVVSLTVTPLMCATMLKGRSRERHTRLEAAALRLEELFLRAYGRSLDFFLNRSWISMALWILCLVGTIWTFSHLPKSFLPVGDSCALQGMFIAQEGTSPRHMRLYQDQIDAIVHRHPSVRIAASISGFSWFPSNQGMLMVFLKPPSEREDIATVNRQLMGELCRIPGAMVVMRPIPALQIQTSTRGSNQGKYSYTVSGVEPQQVYAAAQLLLQRLRIYPALSSASSDLFLSNPEVRIAMDREQIALKGTSVTHLAGQIQSAYAENYIYRIKAPTQQYQVILAVGERFREGADCLDRLYFSGQDGELVHAATVSSPHRAVGPLVVNHTNNFPSATIFFDIQPGVSLGDVVDHVQRLAQEILPPGVQGAFQGEAQTFSSTFRSLTVLIFAAIFITYVILGILYESYAHPLTVLAALPVAALGGLATLFLFHQELSLYAYIGLFMLLGLVEKNGIMVVDFALRQQLGNASPREAVRAAALQRFRPILMTTLSTVMGVLPIALGWGTDGASRRPLGLVVVGGLLFAQVITLFLTPVIYLHVDALQTRIFDRIPFLRRGRVLENVQDEN